MNRFISLPIWIIGMGLFAPFLVLETILSWLFRANKNPSSGFWLAWLAFGRAVFKKKPGLCYAGVADVFESLGMVNSNSYRRFAIGTLDANAFYLFSQRDPGNLFALFGLKKRCFHPSRYLSPGTVLLYPAAHEHGYSDKHGHIEIVISGRFRLSASDHIAWLRSCLEKKEGIAVLESYCFGIGKGGLVPLIKIFDFRVGGILRQNYRQFQANWIEKKYALLQMLWRIECLGLCKASHPIIEGTQLEEYLQARGYKTAPSGIRFVSRLGWLADEPTEIPEYLDHIARVIVHHSARPYLATQDDALEVRRIQERHIARGMSDIGYHFLIAPEGLVYEGRYGPKWTRGEHAMRFNEDSIGVCILGNYDNLLNNQNNSIDENSNAFQALISLCAWLCSEAGLAFDQKTPISPNTKNLQNTYQNTTLPVIVGHKDVDSLLDLPGEQLAVLVDNIIER